MTQEERDELLKTEPQAAPFIRPFMMGKDFIERKPRYCLWLVGASPDLLGRCRRVMERVAAEREFRLASKKEATRQKADTPTLFDEVRECASDYVAIPKVSSESRRYVPMDWLSRDIIAGDKLFMLEDAGLYHFGVLMSDVHMAWMRVVAGRLRTDYRYSGSVVYTNFPWREPSSAQVAAIEATAQKILDVRANYPDATFADLYDELTMPADLRRAHRANDKAVAAAYGLENILDDEPAIIAALFKRYAELTGTDSVD